jgi:hypothetical protein
MKLISQILVALLFSLHVGAQVIVTVAGTGVGGYSGDGGPATNAKMEEPTAIAFDKDGNLYFSDGAISRIRKVTPAGIITTVAGNGSSGYCCDDFLATLAQLKGGGGLLLINGKIFIMPMAATIVYGKLRQTALSIPLPGLVWLATMVMVFLPQMRNSISRRA